VDGDLVESAGGDEQVAREGGHRAVAGGLDAGGEAVGAGEADGLHDVLGGPGLDDGRGPHGDREVPGGDERVVLVVARLVHAAEEPGAELVQRGALGGERERVRSGVRGGGHRWPPGLGC
jgi:hypothetical protein